MISEQSKPPAAGSGLAFRNAFDDRKEVRSRIVAEGKTGQQPLVTIAILTYRRPDYLIEAVRSALAQTSGRPFEIIVMDDDPQSTSAQALLEAVPELRDFNFRYFVHENNLGQFPSHNRGIEYARGEWVSILHDDDLLDPEWLETMLAEIDRRPDLDGLFPRKRTLHQHSTLKQVKLPLPHRLAKGALLESFFLGRRTRPMGVRKFYWGALTGNIAGFIFRRSKAMEVGGFYPEEVVSGDWAFVTRFAKIGKLRQHRAVVATYRVADNLSLKLDNLRHSTEQAHRLRSAMIGNEVPRWWGRFEPMMEARDLSDFRIHWGLDLPAEEVERITGRKPAKDRRYLLWLSRIFLRGF